MFLSLRKIFVFHLVMAVTFLGTPVFAETVELITYYPAQANMGEATLNSAAIGALGDEPGPGELLVESRVRIGQISPTGFEATDANFAIISDNRNIDSGLIHIHTSQLPVFGPLPPGVPAATDDVHFISMSQPTAIGSNRYVWTIMGTMTGNLEDPNLTFARELDTGSPSLSGVTPILTMAWDGNIGIRNESPEAMLHVGSRTGAKGDILLENPRSVMFRAPPLTGQTVGIPQQVLSYTTYPNVLLSNNHSERGGVVISANNDDNTGQIMLRTGLDDPDTSEDEALRLQITNTGQVKIIGDLELEGAFKHSHLVYAGNGDTNGDGNMTVIDALLIINLINNGGRKFANQDQHERADSNGDGVITGLDALYTIDWLNTNGNGSSAGPTPRIIDRALLPQLENHLSVDSSGNLGVNIATPRGGLNNSDISQPQGNNTGLVNAHDVYIRAVGSFVSTIATGNTKLVTGSYVGNATAGRQVVVPEVLSAGTPIKFLVVLEAQGGTTAIMTVKTPEMPGYNAYSNGDKSTYRAGHGIQLTNFGFQVDSGANINENNRTYFYVVFY